jgi:hypothetical protein
MDIRRHENLTLLKYQGMQDFFQISHSRTNKSRSFSYSMKFTLVKVTYFFVVYIFI